MLTAEAIGYRVGRRTILEDVTAAFEPRRLHLVIGPNGAGKSTLVKLLARLVPPSPDDEAICDEMMRLLDVVALGEQPYATLSGGEKQRVNFARVLAQIWRPVDADGRYLFLDEPLTFLDIQHQLRFMQLVRGFADQDDVVVVGVVHDLNLAARFADRVILLDAGAVAVIGTPDEVLTPEHLRNAFHVRPTVVTNPATGGRHLIFD